MATNTKNIQTPSTQYVREYDNMNGISSTWYYDTTITKAGPYKVEHRYTKEYLSTLKEKKKKVGKSGKSS